MAFNNTTSVIPTPFPSAAATPSPSPSINVTVVNITRNELPLLLQPNDPAFPLFVLLWVIIGCTMVVACGKGVQHVIGRVVQAFVNCCLWVQRSSESGSVGGQG